MFVIKAFGRWAKDQGLSETTLLDAVDQANRGIVAADLGGGVVKLRVPRPGRGKSGGYRVVVAFRRGEKACFVYGWSKNELADIDEAELRFCRRLAADFLALTDAQLEAEIERKAKGEIVRKL